MIDAVNLRSEAGLVLSAYLMFHIVWTLMPGRVSKDTESQPQAARRRCQIIDSRVSSSEGKLLGLRNEKYPAVVRR